MNQSQCCLFLPILHARLYTAGSRRCCLVKSTTWVLHGPLLNPLNVDLKAKALVGTNCQTCLHSEYLMSSWETCESWWFHTISRLSRSFQWIFTVIRVDIAKGICGCKFLFLFTFRYVVGEQLLWRIKGTFKERCFHSTYPGFKWIAGQIPRALPARSSRSYDEDPTLALTLQGRYWGPYLEL